MAKILIPIADGYTRTAIVEVPGYPPVRIDYRPALGEAVKAYRREGGSVREEDAMVKLLCDHIRGWDITEDDKDGNEHGAPVGPKAMKRVPEPIRVEMVNYVTGWSIPKQDEAAGNSSAA